MVFFNLKDEEDRFLKERVLFSNVKLMLLLARIRISAWRKIRSLVGLDNKLDNKFQNAFFVEHKLKVVDSLPSKAYLLA